MTTQSGHNLSIPRPVVSSSAANGTFSFLDLIMKADNFPHSDQSERYYKLLLPNDDRPHGYMFRTSVNRMPWTQDFEIDHANRVIKPRYSSSGSQGDISAVCNAAFASVVNTAINKRALAILYDSHSPPCKIIGARYPVQIEYLASRLFGITTRHAYLTVYTMCPDREMRIWVQKRPINIYIESSKLDTSVVAGVGLDDSPLENIVRKAVTGGALDELVIRGMGAQTGGLTFVHVGPGDCRESSESVIEPYCIYTFDLGLPPWVKLVPDHNIEGAEYRLMTVDEVKGALARGEFTNASALVMIDFLIKKGCITPENEQDYTEIVTRLHRKLPFPLSASDTTGEKIG